MGNSGGGGGSWSHSAASLTSLYHLQRNSAAAPLQTLRRQPWARIQFLALEFNIYRFRLLAPAPLLLLGHDLGRKVHRLDALNREPLGGGLEVLVSLALVVVVLHVVEVGEFGLCNDGEAVGARVRLCDTCCQGENVRGAILGR